MLLVPHHLFHISPPQPPWCSHPLLYFQKQWHKAEDSPAYSGWCCQCRECSGSLCPLSNLIPKLKLTLQSMRTSKVICFGLSFSQFFLLFNLTDLILKQSSKTTREKNMQSDEGPSKSQESAALHDARGYWYGQFAEQGSFALQM